MFVGTARTTIKLVANSQFSASGICEQALEGATTAHIIFARRLRSVKHGFIQQVSAGQWAFSMTTVMGGSVLWPRAGKPSIGTETLFRQTWPFHAATERISFDRRERCRGPNQAVTKRSKCQGLKLGRSLVAPGAEH
jgi:hypothetical protein